MDELTQSGAVDVQPMPHSCIASNVTLLFYYIPYTLVHNNKAQLGQ